MHLVAWLPILVMAHLCLAVELKEDAPLVEPPKSGVITGQIQPAQQVKEISLVSRADGSKSPVSFDQASGQFRSGPMSGDAIYDICIITAAGRRVEGIDLSFADARLLHLASERRRLLGLPQDQPRQFTQADAQAITDFVRAQDDFMDLRRAIYIKGHGQRATVLVELMRTRDFHAGKGQVIWRTELWYFQNNAGGWDHLPNQDRVLERRRLSMDDWRRIDIEYLPELSIYIDPQGQSQPVRFTLEQPHAARGRVAGTDFDDESLPTVTNMASTASSRAGSRPASMPATAPSH